MARHNLASQLEIASEFLPYQEIDVYAKVSGYVQKLYVDWGTHVRTGQILADLEIPELQQQLQQDEATVHRGESDLVRAQEELNRAQSEYNVAHLTYTRLADVQKTQPGLVAQQDIDVSQGKDQQANAGLSAAKDSVAASEQALLAAKAALEKDKALYAYSHITAPFDGVVTAIHAYTGALLPAGNFVQHRHLGALPAVAKRSAATGDSGAGKRGAGYSHRPEHRRECVGAEQDLQRQNRPLLRPDRHANAHDAHRSAGPQPEIRAGPGNVCVGANSAACGRERSHGSHSSRRSQAARARAACWS